MARAMTLDEFFEMAKLGGQIKACHDIFEILQNDKMTPEQQSMALGQYQAETLEEFKKAQLKFKMSNGRVRTDEESIESLS